MSRKTRVRFVVGAIVVCAVVVVILGLIAIKLPGNPSFVGIATIASGFLCLATIPAAIKGANRKADEQEALDELVAARKRNQPRR